MCPPNVLQDTLKLLSRVLKSPGCRKIPMMIQNKDDVVVSASNFVSERYTTFAWIFLINFPCLYHLKWFNQIAMFLHLQGVSNIPGFQRNRDES